MCTQLRSTRVQYNGLGQSTLAHWHHSSCWQGLACTRRSTIAPRTLDHGRAGLVFLVLSFFTGAEGAKTAYTLNRRGNNHILMNRDPMAHLWQLGAAHAADAMDIDDRLRCAREPQLDTFCGHVHSAQTATSCNTALDNAHQHLTPTLSG